LDANELTGAIPSCVAALVNLQQLYVFDNQLNSTLPDGLEELTSLRKSTLEIYRAVFRLQLISVFS
jgi:Leucine-rich repeat (LRR) protein